MSRTAETTPQDSSRQRRTAAILAPGLIAFSMGQTVLFAVAGPVVRDIGMSEFQLGMIVSAAAVMFVLASPVWGRIADRWGRKPSIVFGLTAYALISAGFAATMDAGLSGVWAAGFVFFILLGLRLAYAMLGAGIQPASVAMMADLSDAEDRSSAVALVGAAFGIGMILGPAAAALLVGFGVLTPLYAIAGLGLLAAVMALLFLQEPERHAEQKAQSAPLPIGTLAPILAAALLTFIAVSSQQQTIAFYVQDYLQADAQRAAQATGYCFMAMAAATLLAQGGLIQIFKPRPSLLLLTGLPLMIGGLVLYGLAPGFWALVVGCAITGLGFGLVNPGLTSAASLRTGADAQGAVAGIMQATMSGGFVVGPLAGTALYGLGAPYAIGLAVSVLFIAFCAVTLIRHPSPQPQDS